MKFVHTRPYSDPEKAARKIVAIANSVKAVQDGRIYIDLINGPLLAREKGTRTSGYCQRENGVSDLQRDFLERQV